MNTMFEFQRSDGTVRVVQPNTGLVFVTLNDDDIVIVGEGEEKKAVYASQASNLDLVNALIKNGMLNV
jgi:hypothetical protein